MRYDERLLQAQHQLQKTQESLYLTLALENKCQFESALEEAFHFAAESEKLTLLARALPAFTGYPKAKERIEAVIGENVPVTISIIPEGWFKISIPALLPRKEHGNPDYIRGFLYPAMQRFFEDWPPVRFRNCVLCIRHIYDRDRPERMFRDHDNIEVNAVVDALAMFLLPDDSPVYCSHHYCSARGDADGTEAYLVPRADFPQLYLALESGENTLGQ